jgi:PKD repeat protein
LDFTDDFNRPDSTTIGNGWVEVQGDMTILNNELRNEPNKVYHIALQPTLTGLGQTAAIDFASYNNDGGSHFGIIMRYQDSDNYYLLYRQVGATSQVRISKIVNGEETVLVRDAVANPQFNDFFRLEGSAMGTTLKLKLNGVERLSVEDNTFSQGCVGILFGSLNRLFSHHADNFSATIVPPPVADFAGLPTSGNYPLTVNFTDQSAEDVSNWNWDFGDGQTSTAKNPTHQYRWGGLYTVSLTVTGPGGEDTEVKNNYIIVAEGAAPVADFFAIPREGWNAYCAPEFVSTSTGWIIDYLWEFGDGETSSEAAPHHKYAQAGVYTVKLTVAGPGGTASMTKEQYINIKDFADFGFSDYVLTEPTKAAFDTALDAIEATQTQKYTTPPEWCHNGAMTPWCNLMQYGGGGRILFGFSNTTFYMNWDGRIDPRSTWGDSNGKRDFFGDNLIIDGQDKNIGFYYNGMWGCGGESSPALRIHGNDNIFRNIGWDRFSQGLNIRAGMRNLVEGVTTNISCQYALTIGGVNNSCVDCVARNCTYGTTSKRTMVIMFSGDGWQHNTPSKVVICGMRCSKGEPIRMGMTDSKGMLVVRKSVLDGYTLGPRFLNRNNLVIFEDNYSTTTWTGDYGGIRLSENIRGLIRNNIFENSGAYGIYVFSGGSGEELGGANVRIENNIIRNNMGGGVLVTSAPGESNVDIGGGLVDVYANGMIVGPGATPVPGIGRNTIKGNGTGYGGDVINQMTGSPQPVLKAEYNYWDHITVGDVLNFDVSGAVDVDPVRY